MTFPDVDLSDPFISTSKPSSTDLYNAYTAPLNAVAARVRNLGWTTPTLGNSWVSFDGGAAWEIPQYGLFQGVVFCKGLMKLGTSSTTVFTLPAGYRPLKQRVFNVSAGTSDTARINVLPTGVVQVAGYGSAGSNAAVSLDQVIFVAEQ